MNTNKTKTILFLSLILVLLLGACASQETPTPEPEESVSLDYVVAEGHLVPLRSSWLNFASQGRVAEILVEEGDQVTKGQALMRISDIENARAALRAAELELLGAQQAYDDFTRTADLSAANAWQAYQDAQELRGEAERTWEDLDIDYLEDRIDDALVEVQDRKDDLQNAQDEWEKYQDVAEDNYSRQAAEDDLEKAQDDYNQALRDLEAARREIDGPRAALDAALAAESEAQREYEMWDQDGLDLDQKALLESRITAAEARVKAARSSLDDYTITAPFSGTVTDIYLKTGQFVGPDVKAVLLADLSAFKVETSDLTELEVVKITPGQTVEVVPDALPELQLFGKVESVGNSFETQAGDIIYTVTINLDENRPELRWGMTVELTFLPE